MPPELTVAAPNTTAPYVRAAFGPDWIDADHDCHDTRAEVLVAETATPVTFNANGCTVATGRWIDPWGGYTSTLASDFQIDHLVPLADAWRSGAWAWTDQQREAFAQNLSNRDELNAVKGSLNTAKSDSKPDQWKPPLTTAWCRYAASWARIKHDWNLTVSEILGHDRQYVVDPGRRRRPNRLEAVLVGGLADLVRELKVVADKVGRINDKRLQGVAPCEIKHLREVDRDSPDLAR